VLRKILAAISDQAAAIQRQLKQLYDGAFVETADRPDASPHLPGKVEAPDLNAEPNEVVIEPLELPQEDPEPDED
jgi:hypothetical protein